MMSSIAQLTVIAVFFALIASQTRNRRFEMLKGQSPFVASNRKVRDAQFSHTSKLCMRLITPNDLSGLAPLLAAADVLQDYQQGASFSERISTRSM